MLNHVEILVPVALFACITLMVKFITDSRVRRAAIEKEMVNENIKYLFANHFEANIPSSLKWGIVSVFIGIAFIITQFISYEYSDQASAGVIFILAGAGLLVYYFLASIIVKRQKQEGNN